MKYEDLSKPDQCLVHRYLYYCLSTPVISDYEYDRLESAALAEAEESHAINLPGSDMEMHYSEMTKSIARGLLKGD